MTLPCWLQIRTPRLLQNVSLRKTTSTELNSSIGSWLRTISCSGRSVGITSSSCRYFLTPETGNGDDQEGDSQLTASLYSADILCKLLKFLIDNHLATITPLHLSFPLLLHIIRALLARLASICSTRRGASTPAAPTLSASYWNKLNEDYLVPWSHALSFLVDEARNTRDCITHLSSPPATPFPLFIPPFPLAVPPSTASSPRQSASYSPTSAFDSLSPLPSLDAHYQLLFFY